MKFKFILVLTLSMVWGASFAQSGWNWPAGQEELAQEKNVIYTDNLKAKNYAACQEPLLWLMVNAPDLNKSLYQNAAKIYDALATKEKDPARKKQLQDSALRSYDLRIQYFGQKASVLDRKAYYAYKYFKDSPEEYPGLVKLYQEVISLKGNKTMDRNCFGYFDIVRRYRSQDESAFTNEEVLAIYDEVDGILTAQMKTSKKPEEVEKIKDLVDQLLPQIIDVDCDFIANNLGPKLQQDPQNIDLARQIFKLSYAGQCMDLPVFLAATKIIYEQEPSFGMAKLIAVKEKQNGNYENAMKFFHLAEEQAEDAEKQADMKLEIAGIHEKQKNLSQARKMAMEAVALNPAKVEAYTFVGNLYFGSFERCRQNQNKVKDRAVFIAAYEMYAKAGNKSGMANAKSQFPNMEDIFTYDLNVGDPVNIGCWINKTVQVQKRD
ncbi:lipopolysaccharide assembly protein LapB [Persicobacter sp. CCB-QB2]|uniref:tetratricopeptide repeat protein n=1 Tax=Persicobacter sp. CCB-QB2 TaxID=1561025 RepID=UPI0006A95E2C|nr:hypothetical protein [Persicobacter sp. CCB-QB2]